MELLIFLFGMVAFETSILPNEKGVFLSRTKFFEGKFFSYQGLVQIFKVRKLSYNKMIQR